MRWPWSNDYAFERHGLGVHRDELVAQAVDERGAVFGDVVRAALKVTVDAGAEVLELGGLRRLGDAGANASVSGSISWR